MSLIKNSLGHSASLQSVSQSVGVAKKKKSVLPSPPFNLCRTETGTQQKPASKVRVTFYESSKPLVVTSPEPSDLDPFSPHDLIMASPITDPNMVAFDRQLRYVYI